MPQNIVICCDGTCNDATGHVTNVLRIFRCLQHGEEQVCYYDGGVGTLVDPTAISFLRKFIRRKIDMAIGYSLRDNFCKAYRFLVRHYRPGDRIFLFGFSRGAYTARSLVGLIRKCGIPHAKVYQKSSLEGLVKEAYHIYREKAWDPDGREAAAFKKTFSWPNVRIKFLGVWDTVGALGIPVHQVPFSSDYYRWQDTELSRMVENAFHAVALDEHRPDFTVTLWSNAKAPSPRQAVEQRWFPGAHADVGGGYSEGTLWQRPLQWMQERAEACGLKCSAPTHVDPTAALSQMHDSLDEFAGGWYRKLPWVYPYYRARDFGIHEVIDESVWARIQGDGLDERGTPYQPPALRGAKSLADLTAGSILT